VGASSASVQRQHDSTDGKLRQVQKSLGSGRIGVTPRDGGRYHKPPAIPGIELIFVVHDQAVVVTQLSVVLGRSKQALQPLACLGANIHHLVTVFRSYIHNGLGLEIDAALCHVPPTDAAKYARYRLQRADFEQRVCGHQPHQAANIQAFGQ